MSACTSSDAGSVAPSPVAIPALASTETSWPETANGGRSVSSLAGRRAQQPGRLRGPPALQSDEALLPGGFGLTAGEVFGLLAKLVYAVGRNAVGLL